MRVPLISEIYGVKSAIARKVGVSRQMVGLVWNGFKTSARVKAEIDVYCRNPKAWIKRNVRWFQREKLAA